MTTSVKIINFGPNAVKVQTVDRIDRHHVFSEQTVSAGAVSVDHIYIHNSQDIVVEEVKQG